MSDENTPKLRLRPKLAGGPPATPPPAPVNPPMPTEDDQADDSSVPLAVWPEAKPATLRPKLALKPDAAGPAEGAAPLGEPVAVPPPAPVAEPAQPPPLFSPPAPVKPLLVPRVKPTLIPTQEEKKAASDSGATPPFAVDGNGEKRLPAVLNAPPPPKQTPTGQATETWPPVLDAPPPAGLSPISPSRKGDSAEAEPAEITAIRKASTFPFPSPTAKFPPLPGLDVSGGTEPAESVASEGFLKKLLLIGGAVFLLLLGGGAFAYFKYFAKPSAKPAATPVPSKTQTQAQPVPTPASTKMKQMVDKVQQEQLAPLNEVVAAETSSAPVKQVGPGPAPEPAVEKAIVITPPPVPVKPPPPPPSLAFKAWVINIKIRGVRGGDAPRVFIEKTSYVPGEVVNQQLGIMFMGYDDNTRMLTFQDKTGATFERRH